MPTGPLFGPLKFVESKNWTRLALYLEMFQVIVTIIMILALEPQCCVCIEDAIVCDCQMQLIHKVTFSS